MESPSLISFGISGQPQQEQSKKHSVGNLTRALAGTGRSSVNVALNDTWVQCCRASCKKWRLLPGVHDPCTVPIIWYCEMNTDLSRNCCTIPQQADAPDDKERDLDKLDFVNAEFGHGSVVWAKCHGYPWWPAVVDIDPDLNLYLTAVVGADETYCANAYHVVFLGSAVVRQWIDSDKVLSFQSAREWSQNPNRGIKDSRTQGKAMKLAFEQAKSALEMDLKDRIQIFGWEARQTISKTKGGSTYMSRGRSVAEARLKAKLDGRARNKDAVIGSVASKKRGRPSKKSNQVHWTQPKVEIVSDDEDMNHKTELRLNNGRVVGGKEKALRATEMPPIKRKRGRPRKVAQQQAQRGPVTTAIAVERAPARRKRVTKKTEQVRTPMKLPKLEMYADLSDYEKSPELPFSSLPRAVVQLSTLQKQEKWNTQESIQVTSMSTVKQREHLQPRATISVTTAASSGKPKRGRPRAVGCNEMQPSKMEGISNDEGSEAKQTLSLKQISSFEESLFTPDKPDQTVSSMETTESKVRKSLKELLDETADLDDLLEAQAFEHILRMKRLYGDSSVEKTLATAGLATDCGAVASDDGVHEAVEGVEPASVEENKELGQYEQDFLTQMPPLDQAHSWNTCAPPMICPAEANELQEAPHCTSAITMQPKTTGDGLPPLYFNCYSSKQSQPQSGGATSALSTLVLGRRMHGRSLLNRTWIVDMKDFQ